MLQKIAKNSAIFLGCAMLFVVFSSTAFADTVLDNANTGDVCGTTLGGVWDGPSSTCSIDSVQSVSNLALTITHGTTLNGNGNLTIAQSAAFDGYAVLTILGGAGDPGYPTDAVVVDDVIITGSAAVYHGVVLSGYDVTLSNSTINGMTKNNTNTYRNEAGIRVGTGTDTFTLDGNTTNSNVNVGVYVSHGATNGTISNHTASSNTLHGIEVSGSTSVDITTPILTGNGGYGLYVHDFAVVDEYEVIYDPGGPTTIIAITDIYVNNGTMTGNATDVVVDVSSGAGAWDALQSAASNTYVTLTETQGTFPGTQLTVQVPEFRDYMLMLTILISIGFMFKVVPKINTGLRPVA